MSSPFHPGQRWVSEGEPDLGLGSIHRVSPRTVTVHYGGSDTLREYLKEGAPLRRVRFRVGDTLQVREEAPLKVTAVREEGGLLIYVGGGREVSERALSDAMSFSQPEDRLRVGAFDAPKLFDLRVTALRHQHRRRKSPVRGFLGGRIDLLPHQLSVAAEVTGRLAPRVLLADEVGLGKTIEAGLILHRLLLTGRASRVLILVPESLQHQWFVELLRRFNLWFHLFDEARCAALEAEEPSANPFLDDQLILCSLDLFTKDARRHQQALDAGWDLLVVDEAHHLGWSPEGASSDYAAVEALGRTIPGLLLLTATPEQLGMASHFARLRLLDPDRFQDLEAFLEESKGYAEVAALIEALREGASLGAAAEGRLAALLAEPLPELRAKLARIAAGDGELRDTITGALLDQHGTGRVMFRNTRATVTGFPRRRVHLHRLRAEAKGQAALVKELAADLGLAPEGRGPDLSRDPRVEWLADLLRDLDPEKVLLICRTRAKAEALLEALKPRISLRMAVFHEGLTLVQRDRGAAWFAEEGGARLLLCSEIGSEGRNFQFAHHLVLFDLPADPGLLEQRLGRLDRIGQRAEIQVHVPFVVGSPQEAWALWYHEGLDAFSKPLEGGRELGEAFRGRLLDLSRGPGSDEGAWRAALDGLLADARRAGAEVAARLEAGRDRLLEWNSCRPGPAAQLITSIRELDEDRSLDDFLLGMFEHFFIEAEELAPRTYHLGSAGVLAESFPGLTSEGLTVTCDRARALLREELSFLTWDHPLVSGALDLMLGSEKGNCSFARWTDAAASGLYLETIHLLECVAPPSLHADRFLPATPLRIVVDHRGREVGAQLPREALAKVLKPGLSDGLFANPDVSERMLPQLMKHSGALAETKVKTLVAKARTTMAAQLDAELARLKDLRRLNRSVRDEEIDLLAEQKRDLDAHLQGARLRLEALRLIHRGPARG